MNAIVTAGGITQPGEPLYEVIPGGLKSMIEIAGKPMVQWVLDALSEATTIKNVVVVGLPLEEDLQCKHRLSLVTDHGGMLPNAQAGAKEVVRLDPDASHALLVTGDLPALRGDIVDWLAGQVCQMEHDLCYTVIERKTMETQFPQSKRTYVRLQDGEFCGGDMHSFRLEAALTDNPLWKRIINARKSPMRQASLLGFDTLFFLMLQRLSLQSGETMISKRMGITGRVIVSPYAQIGMDVDKPFQLKMLREYLVRGHEKRTEQTE